MMSAEPTDFNPYGLHAIHVPLGLLTYPGVSAGAKLLYGRLALFLGRKQDAYCHPNLRTLATAMHCSVDTITRWLAELIAHGFIKRQRRQRKAAECVFLAHPCLLESATLPDQEPLDSATLRFRVGNSAVFESATLPAPNKEENILGKHSLKTGASGDAQFDSATLPNQKSRTAATSESSRPRLTANGLAAQQEAWFNEWWNAYWLRKARKTAQEAFGKKVQTESRFQQVLTATKAQAPAMMARQPQHRPYGATWLNGQRWEDEPDQPAKLPPHAAPPFTGFYPPIKTIYERERKK